MCGCCCWSFTIMVIYQLRGPYKVSIGPPRDSKRTERSPERTCGGLPEDLQSTYTAFLTEAMTTTASSLICWSFVFQQPRSIITIIIMILRVIFKRYHRSWNCCRTFFVIINVCIAHIRSKITFYLILFQFFLIFNACIHWASNCKQQSTNQLMAIN